MTDLVYYIICGALTLVILLGISMMSKVKTAVNGNLISALATLGAIIVTLIKYDILSQTAVLIICLIGLLIGSVIGITLSVKVKMIQMPEMVALLNGLGGAASALVGLCAMFATIQGSFEYITSVVAVIIGALTLTGSLIAAGKLAKIINGRPVVWKAHQLITTTTIFLMVAIIVASFFDLPVTVLAILAVVISSFFGIAFAIRVGGADMPITISLLNSFSGVAGSIAGMAISDILLVAVGGVVGASGLLLTQIMCRAMNRSLMDILLGKTSVSHVKPTNVSTEVKVEESKAEVSSLSPAEVLKQAKKVIIVPGYGMALAQAQHLVKQLADALEKNGANVKYAIHPVAGRMPGHMNVLLCEADVPYEQLYEIDDINGEFSSCDVCVVIGANDVMNPAAREAVGTPIYGMPILNVDQSKHVIVCNYDLKPGYAGIENPIYKRSSGISLLLGNAANTLQQLINDFNSSNNAETPKTELGTVLRDAKNVIIVPGYGMALAQAQHLVKQLATKFENNGANVRFAIHPVAGRMPGHMNVLLCEADVPYEQLYEIDNINDDFSKCDVCIVVGANDVMNPAARNAVGTPIYGMPILNVDQAKHVVVCNYDLKPGYAGVENPIYKRDKGIDILLGDAKVSLDKLINELNK